MSCVLVGIPNQPTHYDEHQMRMSVRIKIHPTTIRIKIHPTMRIKIHPTMRIKIHPHNEDKNME